MAQPARAGNIEHIGNIVPGAIGFDITTSDKEGGSYLFGEPEAVEPGEFAGWQKAGASVLRREYKREYM